MDREEFEKILRKHGVPDALFNIWWTQWTKYTAMFKLESQYSSLEFFAKNNVEKGCCANAPW